jgi:V/A-type H+-transporting ATPase subunit I
LVTLIVWAATASSLSTIGLYCIYAILGICALFILFYSNPDRKILLVNIGGGLWGTYNMVSGLLGDVLSYIRLFALGLAGGILGNVFNALALQAGGALPGWIGWLPTLLIMVFGHALNFALCLISSVVHPMRLTFVEFYKNAGFEGGGKEYKPFKK